LIRKEKDIIEQLIELVKKKWPPSSQGIRGWASFPKS
jgi:hypothetical protein